MPAPSDDRDVTAVPVGRSPTDDVRSQSSSTYGVTGSPTSGRITTVSDLLGRTVSYTDVWGTVTTAAYDLTGRLVSSTATPPVSSDPPETESYLYNIDGQVTQISHTVGSGAANVIAVPTYDTHGQLTSVSYPSGTGKAGNGTSLSAIIRDVNTNATTGMTWAFPAQNSVTDAVVRSQSGRILTDSLTDGSSAASTSSYSYDPAGRLVSATIPGHQLAYAYAATGGCGANVAAGLDGNRTASSDTHNNGTTTVTTSTVYCYDNADRLTGTTVTNPVVGVNPVAGTNLSTAGTSPTIVYDAHGNTTTLADETLGYDGSDRHLTTTLTDGTSVSYLRDVTDRIVSQTTTIAGVVTTVRYSFTGGGDSPDFTLDVAGAAALAGLPVDWNPAGWAADGVAAAALVGAGAVALSGMVAWAGARASRFQRSATVAVAFHVAVWFAKSAHAKKKQAKQAISQDMIDQAMRTGRKSSGNTKGTTKYSGKSIVVITNTRTGNIITTYRK
jgi:YD repeat-containing protein